MTEIKTVQDTNTRILICDDIPLMRKIVSEGLRGLGFRNFVEAENGDGAWSLLENSDPGIEMVICDLNMRGGTGMELLKRMRNDERFRQIPFIMLTASSEKVDVASALSNGVSAYVIKPFSTSTLGGKIAAIQRQSQLVK